MDLRVVLVEPQEGGNIGSVARVMKNFGFGDLVLVNPCEIGKDARRFSSHGRDVLLGARKVGSLGEAIDGCGMVVGTTGKRGGKKTLSRVALDPERFAENARNYNGRIALLLGRESIGLKNEELDMCDFVVRIGASRSYPILNIAQAACVLLYELSKPGFRKTVREKGAGMKEREAMEGYLDEAVDSAYGQEHRRRIVKGMMRRIMGKAFLTKQETTTIAGLLRKIRRNP